MDRFQITNSRILSFSLSLSFFLSFSLSLFLSFFLSLFISLSYLHSLSIFFSLVWSHPLFSPFPCLSHRPSIADTKINTKVDKHSPMSLSISFKDHAYLPNYSTMSLSFLTYSHTHTHTLCISLAMLERNPHRNTRQNWCTYFDGTYTPNHIPYAHPIRQHKQCDQIGRFIGLWATFIAFGNN